MEKYRAIFLIEADFNFIKKLYFAYIIIKKEMGNGLVPL